MKRIRILAVLVAVGPFGYQQKAQPIYAAGVASVSKSASAATSPTESGQTADTHGAQLYAEHCAICHGVQREGMLPGFPPLLGVQRHMTDQQITTLLSTGRGRMPAFPKINHEEVTALLRYLSTNDMATSANESGANASESGANTSGVGAGAPPSGVTQIGARLFQQNCAFCHGRDGQGGETGPDLTRSKLVISDVRGDKISEVVRNGRLEKKMPAFNFSGDEMLGLAAFIHAQELKAVSQAGRRKGVDVADLQSGNIEAGKQYFNGAGTCSSCHSPEGDLAGVATRYQGLQLEERMLYPKDAKSRVTVTLHSGQKVSGVVAYMDEFTVGLSDVNGNYRYWPVGEIKYALDSPVQAHADLFGKYTDDDIHNLMAYIQTLR